MTARGGSAEDRRWRAWLQRPHAPMALTLVALWEREHALMQSDEYLDALVGLANGEIAPRRAWGPLRRLAMFLLEDSEVVEAERLPSYWSQASICRVPEGWQARVGSGSTVTIVATWPTSAAAELTCRTFRPHASVAVVSSGSLR